MFVIVYVLQFLNRQMEWALFSRGINQVPLVYISSDLQDSDKCGHSGFICGWQSGHSVTDRTDWQVICVFFIDLLRGLLAPETDRRES